MPARRVLSFGFSLTLLIWTATALASPASRRGARLVWARGDRADACVGVTGLTEDVKARLGYNPFVLPPEIEIEGTAQRTAKGFRADLTFRSADGKPIGKRELESRDKDCSSLGEAVAVAITVAIDPDASGAAPPLVEEVPHEPPPSIGTPTPPPVVVPPAIEPRVRVTVGGGASAGLVPGIGGLASLRAGFIAGEHFEIGVGATYVPESRERAFGFGLAAGEARGCILPWRARGILRLCGAALVGAFEVYAYSTELDPVDVGVFPWLGAELGPILSVPIYGPLRIELGASAIVPIVRRQGFIRGAASPLWEQSHVGGRAEASGAVLF